MIKKFILSIPLYLLASIGLFAQVSITMDAGTADLCAGALLDSGGELGPGYSNDEQLTLTLCPDQADGAISLQWLIWDLSTAGNAPLDNMVIYDGNSTAAPVIGTWTGTSSPGIVSASFANTSGCLTLVFTSNNTGTGFFSASITCYEPCEPPTAVASVTGETLPVLACIDEVLTFDASASYAAAGFNIVNYTWIFDDNSIDSTSGAVVEHAYTQAGGYVVQVEIEDNNGCVNTNTIDLQVLVSTTPDFSGITQGQTICTGSTLEFNGQPTVPVTWTGVPESNLGGEVALPDQQGVPFSTTIDYTSFSPGQTLEDPDDITVCVNMEHSYMGDLIISMSCPNGQSVVFHQQGGGGTFLGDANDDEPAGTDPVIGECWEYCWSNTATLGTWSAEANLNEMPASQGDALIPDTYSSVQPFSQLVGCPLNGTWTFTIVDMLYVDNGFLCDWEVNFDPELFPDLVEFTPELGLNDTDSAYWTGPGIDGQGPGVGVITPDDPGDYDYTFNITDNFGCTYDTTVTVTVIQGPDLDLVISGTDTMCDGGIAQLAATPGYESYIWSNGFTGPIISTPPNTYTVTALIGECEYVSPPYTVNVVPQPQPVITGSNLLCGNEPVLLTTTEPFDNIQWSNGSYAASILAGGGTYYVTAVVDGCAGTSPGFEVVPASDPQASFTIDPLSPQNVGVTVDVASTSTGNGSPLTGQHWIFEDNGEESFDVATSHTFNIPGTHNITLVVTASDGCTDTLRVPYDVIPEAVILVNVITPNGDGMNDMLVFENAQYVKNDLVIMDRWGTKVFEARNYQNNWRAQDVMDGTYFYVLRLDNGQEHTGQISVIR